MWDQITIVGFIVVVNISAIIMLIVSRFLLMEKNTTVETVAYKEIPINVENAAKYMIILRFNPKQIEIRFATITVDLFNKMGRFTARMVISPRILRTSVFVNMNERFAKMKLLRLSPLSGFAKVVLNHNIEENLFVYSVEIQDINKNISYYFKINQTIKKQSPSDSDQNVKSFQCLTKKNIVINEFILPQNILGYEFVCFVYFLLNITILFPVLIIELDIVSVKQTALGLVRTGLVSSLMATIITIILMLIFRYDIKTRYALTYSKKWELIKNLFLVFIGLIGFISGLVATLYALFNNYSDPSEELVKHLVYSWTIAWIYNFIAVIAIVLINYFLK